MITYGGLFHEPKSNYSYGYDHNNLHIRVRALKGEIESAICRIGDPYIWEKGGAGGGNMNAEDSYGWTGASNYPMVLEATTIYHDYFFVQVPQDTKRSRYAFILKSDDETILFGEKKIVQLDVELQSNELNKLTNFFCFPYLNGQDVLRGPDWVKGTVWYQIFPERFANGDRSNDPVCVQPWGTQPTGKNYMGGDLQGVMDHLDYLADLGITGVHFCPIFQGDCNHKYETTDYKTIDPSFGRNELFKKFVEEAHARGIRVMLDGVFNHTGVRHPFFQDVLEKGEDSKYKDWFCVHEFPVKKGSYETFASVQEMPKINLENNEAMNYFVEVGKYWVREYNIDGWRLDVSNEISHEFWRVFRKEIHKVNPEVYIVGEVWHDALPWLRGEQFDAVMHYPLMEACIDFFATAKMDAIEFKETISQLLVNYPMNVNEISYNILDSHDTARFLAVAGDDLQKQSLAFAFLFTHVGCPALYYGDEVGLLGENRRCMEWDSSNWNMEVFNNLKELIQIRKDEPVLTEEAMEWLSTSVTGLIVYRKGNILVLLNNSSTESIYHLPVQYRGEALNLRSNQCVTLNEEIHIKGMEYQLFKISIV